MSAENWGPCPECKTPLSRANASRLRSGAVVHVGCKARSGFAGTLIEEVALGQAAKGRISALAAGLPDPGMPGDGPLVQASGPTDYEALGRERYHDSSPAMREAQLPGIVEQLKPGTPEEDRRFAGGWLAERDREKRMPTDRAPGKEADRQPPARKERRRVSLREPLTQEQRDAFVMMGPRGLAATLPPADAEEGPNIDVRSDGSRATLTLAGGAAEYEVEALRLGPEKPSPSLTREAVEAAGSVERVARVSMQGAVELGPDGTEVVTLPPLAKADPPEPVHILVPGFPGYTCCAAPVREEKPAVRGKRGRKGAPGRAASPATPRTQVTTDRSAATCSSCLEVYEDADALAGRIEELRGEEGPPDPEPCDCNDEDQWEAEIRKERDKEQKRMLAEAAGSAATPQCERHPDELIHLFDGFPEVRPASDAAGGCIETRCGIATSKKFVLVPVPFSAGHPRCCTRCAELPQPRNARSYGSFVAPDCIADPTEDPACASAPVGKPATRRRR